MRLPKGTRPERFRQWLNKLKTNFLLDHLLAPEHLINLNGAFAPFVGRPTR